MADLDFVFLGQTVPTKRVKSDIVQVCAAGYSPTTHTLHRIYPLPVRFGGQRWQRYTIPVERSTTDSRRESLKISSDHRRTNLELLPSDLTPHGKVDRVKALRDLQRMVAPSIAYLNDGKCSLGLIRPNHLRGYWQCNPEHAPLLDQADLFSGHRRDITKRGREHWARVAFDDGHQEHDMMLNAWDVYEWHRKHASTNPLDSLWGRLGFESDQHDHLLLIGNMHRIRNRWLVIAVLQYKREAVAPTHYPLLDFIEGSAA